MTIAPELLRRIVEGALLAAGQPLTEDRLLSLIDEGERPEKAQLREVLEQIAESGAERGFELKQVASGWRFQVPEDLAPWVNRLWEEKPQKYSRAILETLAIIAYRQPITRGDIEEIRGVAVSSHIVKTLSERGWIKVVGQRDVPGKPSLYATTREFLDYFNLRTLDDLPTLAEIRDIDSLNRALDLDQGGEKGGAEGEDVQGADGQPEVPPEEAAEPESVDSAASDETETEDAADPEPEQPEAEAGRDAAAVEEIAAAVAAEGAENETEEGEAPAADFAPEAIEAEATKGAGTADVTAEEADGEIESEDQPVADIEPESDGEAVADTGEAGAGDGEEEPAAGLAAELPPSSLFAAANAEQDSPESAEDDGESRDTEQTENAPS